MRRRIYKTVPPKDGEKILRPWRRRTSLRLCRSWHRASTTCKVSCTSCLLLYGSARMKWVFMLKRWRASGTGEPPPRAHMHKSCNIRHNITFGRFLRDAAVASSLEAPAAQARRLAPQRAISATAGATDPTDASGSLLPASLLPR